MVNPRHLAPGGFLLLLAVLPASGQEAAFRTEAEVGFVYEGGKTEEPLVAIGGVPAAGYFYRADSAAHELAVSATRHLTLVGDDGTTPYSLLPFVERTSFLTARFGLGGTNRDSSGSSQGAASALTARLSGDRTLRSGEFSAEWYFERATALRTSFATESVRGTDAADSRETPSGAGALSRFDTRGSTTAASLGLLRWLGPQTAVTLAGTWESATTRRADETLFSSSGFQSQELESTGKTWGGVCSVRMLLLSRRLVLLVAGAYDVTDSDLAQSAPSVVPLAASRAIGRRLWGAATWHPERDWGLTLRGEYATQSEAGGLNAKTPLSYQKSVVLGATAEWFPRPRAAVRLAFSRTSADTVTPPDSATYQEFQDTVDRVDLTVSIRF